MKPIRILITNLFLCTLIIFYEPLTSAKGLTPDYLGMKKIEGSNYHVVEIPEDLADDFYSALFGSATIELQSVMNGLPKSFDSKDFYQYSLETLLSLDIPIDRIKKIDSSRTDDLENNRLFSDMKNRATIAELPTAFVLVQEKVIFISHMSHRFVRKFFDQSIEDTLDFGGPGNNLGEHKTADGRVACSRSFSTEGTLRCYLMFNNDQLTTGDINLFSNRHDPVVKVFANRMWTLGRHFMTQELAKIASNSWRLQLTDNVSIEMLYSMVNLQLQFR